MKLACQPKTKACIVHKVFLDNEEYKATKISVNQRICRNLPATYDIDGNPFCVLHAPTKYKLEEFSKEFRILFQEQKNKSHNPSNSQFHFDFDTICFPSEIRTRSFDFDEVLKRYPDCELHISFTRCSFLQDFVFSNPDKYNYGFISAEFHGRALFYNLDAEKTMFNGAKFFGKEANFSCSRFEQVAFTGARFSKDTHANFNFSEFPKNKISFFNNCFFEGKTSFIKARFGEVHWQASKFKNVAEFCQCVFEKPVVFSNARLKGLDFREAVFKDSLTLIAEKAKIENKEMFYENPIILFSFAIFEKPNRVKFQSIGLFPHWFINVDVRKFSFLAVDWQHVRIDKEIERSLKVVKVTHPIDSLEVLRLTYRQLAENAENSRDFQESSRFRRLAFEIEWREKTEKISNWIENLVAENEKLKKRFGGSQDEENKPTPPINSFGILRRSGDFIIHGLYRMTSLYGESWGRALVWFILICPIFALLFYLFGTFNETPKAIILNNFEDYLSYSLQVMTLQRPEPKPIGFWTTLIYSLEILFAPIQLALLALALRRKFMR